MPQLLHARSGPGSAGILGKTEKDLIFIIKNIFKPLVQACLSRYNRDEQAYFAWLSSTDDSTITLQ